jgi:Tfp pilus assembly protein PilN
MKPRRLHLDHYAPPWRSRWPGYLLLALAVFTAAEVTQRYRAAQLAAERHEATRNTLNLQQPPVKPIPKNRLDEQVKSAQTVVRQLTLPWARLIKTIETAGSNDVAILQLQPDAQQRMLRITAEARSEAAMVEYLRRLAGARGFAYVHLLSHQVQEDDPQRPIQFSAQASFQAMQ